jgi:hypothetical protein
MPVVATPVVPPYTPTPPGPGVVARPIGPTPPACRCSAADVRKIIDFDPSITDFTPFISAANQLVTEICANSIPPWGEGRQNAYRPQGEAAQPGQSYFNPYDQQRLATIETWLAAHFLAIRDPRYASERLGQAAATYTTQVGMNLSATPYGQQAAFLDTHGGLAWLDKHISQGKRGQVGIVHLGSNRAKYWGFPWRFYELFGNW